MIRLRWHRACKSWSKGASARQREKFRIANASMRSVGDSFSFDAKCVAACRGATHVNVINVGACKKAFDGRVHTSGLDVFLRQQPPATAVGIECSGAFPQRNRETCVLRITFA